jgi:Ca2+-binding RTX toxin-like protein
MSVCQKRGHSNLILGGDGNDQLSGGSGRGIMVGGNGADKFVANGNDDILIAGFTTKDTPNSLNHEDFWCDVLDEWTSDASFLARVNNLRNGNLANDTPSLVAEVFDDLDSGSVDMLQGSSGNDWFIFDMDEDKVTGQTEAGTDVE